MHPITPRSRRALFVLARILFAAGAALAVGLASGQEVTDETSRTPEELDKLVAPIALYPDALVALILPASTVPTDVTLAARFLAAGRSDTAIEDQPWDDSVKALVHYPEVVKWMDENLVWTRELGLAFADQSTDVMNAVQRMRAQARTAGTLQDTPQQEVVVRDQIIYIEPATPDVIYVPSYNYEIVYGPPPFGYAGPFLTFGIGYSIGAWLDFDLDWHRRVLWRGVDWRRRDIRGRHYGAPAIAGHPYRPPQRWHPPVNRVRPRPGFHRGDRVVGPRMLPTGPVERGGGTERPTATFGHSRPATAKDQPLVNGAPTVRRWPQGGQPRSHVNAGSPPTAAPTATRPSTVTRPPTVAGQPRPTRPAVSPRPEADRANVHFNTSRPMVTPSGPVPTVRAPAAPVLAPQARPAPLPQARPVPLAPQARPAPMAPPPAMRPVTAPAPRSAPAERPDTPAQRRDDRADKER